jgi:cytochrome c-type biogenesis protein CcmH
MPRGFILLFLALGFAGAVFGVAVAQEKPVSFQDIEESLTCQCGCGLTVHSCNHLQCGSALPLREEIREQMAAGNDKDAVLAHFAEKYGEKILSSPGATGFNLLAWVTPFVLVGVGAVVVGVTLMRWRSISQPPAPQKTEDSQPPPRSAYDKILERELKNFDS